MGRYYEPPESAQFNFGAVFLTENALQPLGWAHRWNVTHKNNQNQLGKQVFIRYWRRKSHISLILPSGTLSSSHLGLISWSVFLWILTFIFARHKRAGCSPWSRSLINFCLLCFIIVIAINNQSMKAKLMPHIKHYAVHGPSTWFISSLPPLKWTFIAESSLCWRLKLWAVINEGHGFREASLLISCDNGTRWRPWSAASGKKSSNLGQVRGTQDHLPRVALEPPWLSSELLSLSLC